MKNWNVYWNFLSLFSLVFLLLLPSLIYAQKGNQFEAESTEQVLRYMLRPDFSHSVPHNIKVELSENRGDTTIDTSRENGNNSLNDYPDPGNVLLKSVIIPGWGQVVNNQIWKVPIVYGLIGGLAGYSVYLTKQYHDFRAAFFNATHDEINPDFGPTPASIPENTSPQELKSTRDRLRNRRDFIYIVTGLAYGLNVLDAYIFAHLRSFDVSKDLSMNTTVKPNITYSGRPGLTVSVDLIKRTGKR